LPGWGRLRE